MTVIDRRYSVAEGTAVKAPCRAATTANITLSGEQTIDGVAVVDGDRVLVKDQTTGSQNGIYTASTGNWSRARDFDGAYDIVTGTRVWVTSGTANGRTEWEVTTTGTITIDTTSIAFSVTSSLAAAFADGTVAAPGASFANYPSWGFYKTASGIGVAISGVKVFEFLSNLFVETAHIAANAVTLAKLVAASAQGKILGRKTASSGTWEECTLSELIDLTGSTQGQILYRGASSWSVLSPGTSGQFLQTQGSGANPQWGDRALVKISSATAAPSSSLAFTSGIDSTYREYVFAFDAVLPVTDNVQLICEVSTDAGSNWKATTYLQFGSVLLSSGSGNVSMGTGTTCINISGVSGTSSGLSNTAGHGFSGEVRLYNPSSASTRKQVEIARGNYMTSGDAVAVTGCIGGGFWNGGNTAIDGIRFRFSSGNIASGSITMYGLK